MEEGTFELKCGVTLHLRALNRQALRPIMLKLGGDRTLQDPERLRELTGKAKERAVQGIEQMFNYCAGWGVEDDAPEDAIDELAELGFRMDTARLARVNWIRYSLLEDEEEAGRLTGAVLVFSSRGWIARDEEASDKEASDEEASDKETTE